jgi:hypothetical protein
VVRGHRGSEGALDRGNVLDCDKLVAVAGNEGRSGVGGEGFGEMGRGDEGERTDLDAKREGMLETGSFV